MERGDKESYLLKNQPLINGWFAASVQK